ncbi:MAG: polysaccharide deacetylase family protein, partial [bacterium]
TSDSDYYYWNTGFFNYATDGWNELALNRSNFLAAGAPDWSRITAVEVRVKAVLGTTLTVTFDELATLPEVLPRGIVIITNDDLNSVQMYDTFGQELIAHDMPASLFVDHKALGAGGAISVEDMRLLQDTYGWDIANHSWTHSDFTVLSTEERITDITQMSAWMWENGFRAWDIFAYPLGHYDADTIRDISPYLTVARGVSGRNDTSYLVEPYRMSARPVDLDTSLVTTQGWVDSAAQNNEVLILTFHSITDNPVAGDDLSWATGDFSALLDYIAASDVEVMTMSEYLARYAQYDPHGTYAPVEASGQAQGFALTADYSWQLPQSWDIDRNGHGAWPNVQNALSIDSPGIGYSALVDARYQNRYVIQGMIDVDEYSAGQIGLFIEEGTLADGIFTPIRQIPVEIRTDRSLVYVTDDYVVNNPQVNAARLVIQVTQGSELHAYIDDLRFSRIREPYAFTLERPRVVFRFDDGFDDQYVGAQFLQQYGFPAVINIATDRVGRVGYMDWQSILELDSLGVQIGSHTRSHDYFNNASQAEWYDEIVGAKGDLEVHGVEVDTFASPRLEHSYWSDSIILRHYASYQGGEGGEGQGINVFPYNPYNLRSRVVSNATSPLTVMAWIDEAIRNNQTLVLIYHKFNDNPQYDTEVRFADFSAVVEYVDSRSGDIDVTTVDAFLTEQDNALVNLLPNSSFGDVVIAPEPTLPEITSADEIVRPSSSGLDVFFERFTFRGENSIWIVGVKSDYLFRLVVTSYSILSGLYIFSRLLQASFYRAPKSRKYYPYITVITPAYNEGAAVKNSILRTFGTGYPMERVSVVAINDGSRDNTLEYIQEAAQLYPDNVIVINFTENCGKREGMYAGMQVASALSLARKQGVRSIEETEVILRDLEAKVKGALKASAAQAIVEATRRELARMLTQDINAKDAPVNLVIPKGMEEYFVNPSKLPEDALGLQEDAVVFVDSDSYLRPNAIYNVVQPLYDRKIGAVAGHADIHNPTRDLLTAMQAITYFT